MDILMGILSTIFKVDEQINNKNRNSLSSDEVTIVDDIEYTIGQKLDVYYSTKFKGNMPVLINVHGGGWMVGDKKWRKGIATMYAEHGFFVINPNYSLSPDTYYPDCVRDIFKAVDWVYDNAGNYSLDLDRVYITGDSAGGHIAAMVAAIQHNDAELERLGITTPKCYISKTALFCGVYDYDKCVDQPGAQGLVKDMTGVDHSRYYLDFKYYRELSPINYVDETFPPTYMVSAPLDIFCGGQAELLENRLRNLNIPCRHYVPEDRYATHCWHLNLNREDSIEAIEGAIDFLMEEDV